MARTPPSSSLINKTDEGSNIKNNNKESIDNKEASNKTDNVLNNTTTFSLKHTFCKDKIFSENKIRNMKNNEIYLTALEHYMDLNSCMSCLGLYYKFRSKYLEEKKNANSILFKFDIYRILTGENKFLVWEILSNGWYLLKNNGVRIKFFDKLKQKNDQEIYTSIVNSNFPVEMLYLSKSHILGNIAEKIINQNLFKRGQIYNAYLSAHNYCITCDNIINNPECDICRKYSPIKNATLPQYVDFFEYMVKKFDEEDEESKKIDYIDYENVSNIETLTILLNLISTNTKISHEILYLFEEFQNFNPIEKALTSLILCIFLSKMYNKKFENHDELFEKSKELQHLPEDMDLTPWTTGTIDAYKHIIIEGFQIFNDGFQIDRIPEVINIIPLLAEFNYLTFYLKCADNKSLNEIILLDLLESFELTDISSFFKNLSTKKMNTDFSLQNLFSVSYIQGQILTSLYKSGYYSSIILKISKILQLEVNSINILFPKLSNYINGQHSSKNSTLLNELNVPILDLRILNSIINILAIELVDKSTFKFYETFEIILSRKDKESIYTMIKELQLILQNIKNLPIQKILNFVTFFKTDYTSFLSASSNYQLESNIEIIYQNKSVFFDSTEHFCKEIVVYYKILKDIFDNFLDFMKNEISYLKDMFDSQLYSTQLNHSFFSRKIGNIPDFFINYVVREVEENLKRDSLYENLLKRMCETANLRTITDSSEVLNNVKQLHGKILIEGIEDIVNLYSQRGQAVKNKKETRTVKIASTETVNNKEDGISLFLLTNRALNSNQNIMNYNFIVNQEKYFLLRLQIMQKNEHLNLKYQQNIFGNFEKKALNVFQFILADIHEFMIFHKEMPKMLECILSIISKADSFSYELYLNIFTLLTSYESVNIEKFLLSTFKRVENMEKIFENNLIFTILKKGSTTKKFVDEIMYQSTFLFKEKHMKEYEKMFIEKIDRIYSEAIYKRIRENCRKKGWENMKTYRYFTEKELEFFNEKEENNEKEYGIKLGKSLISNQKGINLLKNLIKENEKSEEEDVLKLTNSEVYEEYLESNKRKNLEVIDYTDEESFYESSSDEEVTIKTLQEVDLESSSFDEAEIKDTKEQNIKEQNIKDAKEEKIKDIIEKFGDVKEVYVENLYETVWKERQNKIIKDRISEKSEDHKIEILENNLEKSKEEDIVIKGNFLRIKNDEKILNNSSEEIEIKIQPNSQIIKNLKEENKKEKQQNSMSYEEFLQKNIQKEKNKEMKIPMKEKKPWEIFNQNNSENKKNGVLDKNIKNKEISGEKRIKMTEKFPYKISPEFERKIAESKAVVQRETQLIDITKKLTEQKNKKPKPNEYFSSHQICGTFDSMDFIAYILNISIYEPLNILRSPNLLSDFRDFEEFFETYKSYIYLEAGCSLISDLTNYNTILNWEYMSEDTSQRGSFMKYKFITDSNEKFQVNNIILFTNSQLNITSKGVKFLEKSNVDEDLPEYEKLFDINPNSSSNLFNNRQYKDYVLGVIDSIEKIKGRFVVNIKTKYKLSYLNNLTKILSVSNISSSFKELKSLYRISEFKYADLLVKPSLLSEVGKMIRSAFLDNLGEEKIFNCYEKMLKDFKLNSCQKDAIDGSLGDEIFSLIQGPPGTGKTTTIIALTSLLANMGLRVMVAAPSNTAVDHLTRLIYKNDKFQNLKVTRLGIIASAAEDIRPLMPGHLTNSERIKNRLSDKNMTAQYLQTKAGNLYRQSHIFTSTLNSSYVKELKNQIDVLIVDEVCQSVDTSFFVSLSLIPKKVVLIGDPNQLPPTIISGSKAFEATIFSRLSQYQQVNLLNVQYRMHPDIAKFPSEYFYNDKLENGIEDEIFKKVLGSVDIHYFPCSFISVSGKERHLANSYYNETEIDVCMHLINKIYSKPLNRKLTIGVITPYSAQANKFKEKVDTLSPVLKKNIQISTVDGFQGQEKDFILFSTVRTEKIGFLKDERRINVAFTRAKYGLCVLGNKKALNTEVWLRFYEYNKIKGKSFRS